MSMFSIHYVIRCKRGYWNGGPPQEASSWDKDCFKAIGVHSRADANALCNGVLKHIPDLKIEDQI